MRTRLKTAVLPAAYERMSSICCGRTDVNPRSVLTSTGKKQSNAAMKIFELFSIPNQALAIGANAMIGTALAAMKYGINAEPSGLNRASSSAAAIPKETPATNPQKASVNVYQPAGQRTLRSFQNADAISLGFGRRNFWIPKRFTATSQPTRPRTRITRAGVHSARKRRNRVTLPLSRRGTRAAARAPRSRGRRSAGPPACRSCGGRADRPRQPSARAPAAPT